MEKCFLRSAVGGKELCADHFLLLAPALRNCCFSLQIAFEIDENPAEMQQFIEFFSYLEEKCLHKLPYKLLKISASTNRLAGNDVIEQLLSLLCSFSRVNITEFVELHLHFSNCPNLSIFLPTESLIKRLCFIDPNPPCSRVINKGLPFSFNFNITLHFHTIPSRIELQLNQLQVQMGTVSFL